MARRMQKRTRNIVTGMLVGLASIFAVINFADIPTDDVLSFIFSTLLFFVAIIVMALLVVSLFKLGARLLRKLSGKVEADTPVELPPDYYSPKDRE